MAWTTASSVPLSREGTSDDTLRCSATVLRQRRRATSPPADWRLAGPSPADLLVGETRQSEIEASEGVLVDQVNLRRPAIETVQRGEDLSEPGVVETLMTEVEQIAAKLDVVLGGRMEGDATADSDQAA